MSKEVIVYHTEVDENSSPDNLDVLKEAEFVSENLKKLGFTPKILQFIYDKEKIKSEIKKIKPEFIFNLVESVNKTDSLAHLAASLFEDLKIPYTGSPAKSLFQTSDKLISKEILRQNKIKTPKYLNLSNYKEVNVAGKFLIKNSEEHSSFGLDEKTLFLPENKKEVIEALKNKSEKYFAEQYIDGREFNISILGNPTTILPIAEMKFSNYPKGKPKIIGYRAKWDEDSYEYQNTVRSFDFEKKDELLLKRLKEICIKCWNLFNLNGYARIDFRAKNQIPYVLEINTNPCISPDAGLTAAAERAGLSHVQLVSRIIENLNKNR
jgi:D-alanine-D-alanine ligase